MHQLCRTHEMSRVTHRKRSDKTDSRVALSLRVRHFSCVLVRLCSCLSPPLCSGQECGKFGLGG